MVHVPRVPPVARVHISGVIRGILLLEILSRSAINEPVALFSAFPAGENLCQSSSLLPERLSRGAFYESLAILQEVCIMLQTAEPEDLESMKFGLQMYEALQPRLCSNRDGLGWSGDNMWN